MRVSKYHPLKFGDILCNTNTGKYYAVAGATTAVKGKRRFITFIEVNSAYECMHEPPISFDKETVAELVFVTTNYPGLLKHVQDKEYQFNFFGIGEFRFTCRSR